MLLSYHKGKDMHPSTSNILQYFKYDHLPVRLQSVSQPFATIARVIANDFEGPEVTACLRKLLEAKDCAVRAALTSTKPHSGGLVNPQDQSDVERLREQAERVESEDWHTRKLTKEEQRDFNSAQAELTRLRQERAMREQDMAVDPQQVPEAEQEGENRAQDAAELYRELRDRFENEPEHKHLKDVDPDKYPPPNMREITEQAERVFESDPKRLKDITGELSKREVTETRPKMRPVNQDDEADFDD